MNAKPRRRWSGWRASDESVLGIESEYAGEIIEIPCQRGTVVIECELYSPPSMKGRTVYVAFQDEDLTDALKVLRDAAIYARSKPMEATQ